MLPLSWRSSIYPGDIQQLFLSMRLFRLSARFAWCLKNPIQVPFFKEKRYKMFFLMCLSCSPGRSRRCRAPSHRRGICFHETCLSSTVINVKTRSTASLWTQLWSSIENIKIFDSCTCRSSVCCFKRAGMPKRFVDCALLLRGYSIAMKSWTKTCWLSKVPIHTIEYLLKVKKL